MSAKASVEEIQDGLNNEEIIELQDLRYSTHFLSIWRHWPFNYNYLCTYDLYSPVVLCTRAPW